MELELGKLLYDDSNTESARLYKSSAKKKLIASEAFIVGVWLFLLYCWWSQCNTMSACLSNLLSVLLLISICAFIILGIVTLLLRYWGGLLHLCKFLKMYSCLERIRKNITFQTWKSYIGIL